MAGNNKSKTVCVLFGGVSTEHIISLKSAYNVIISLRKAGFNVVTVGISRNGNWIGFTGNDADILNDTWENHIEATPSGSECRCVVEPISVRDFIVGAAGTLPDVIFPVIHGINCEDGTVQGILELSGIPYVGCNVLASAAGMDKLHSKRIFKSIGIPQCKFINVSRDDITDRFPKIMSEVTKKIGYPCFIKPNNGGSSLGTKCVLKPEELQDALFESSKFDNIILIEEWVLAREIEAAVMGNESPKVALLGEVITSEDIQYYDYNTKYFSENGSHNAIPADLSPAVADRIKRYAKKAYLALSCSGLSRVDFFIDKKNGRILINEINTIPGFTPTSLYPKAWELSGVSPEQLVTKLCNYAIAYKKSRNRLEII